MSFITTKDLHELKNRDEKITVLTSYDASFTQHIEQAGVEVILVGDSLGMVVLGYESTVSVTMEEMLHHAKATVVYVTLKNRGSHLVMTIQDNGRGFSQETTVSGGMGLETMRQRIESIGGRFLINSLVNIGTKIELSINLETYGEN